MAFALHLPALAWVEGRLRLPVLRPVGLGIAAAVLVRLILNLEVLHYAVSEAAAPLSEYVALSAVQADRPSATSCLPHATKVGTSITCARFSVRELFSRKNWARLAAWLDQCRAGRAPHFEWRP